MKRKSVNTKQQRNQMIGEIYESYRNELERILDLAEMSPQRFTDIESIEYLERKVERLDTLIAVYRDLLVRLEKR